MKKKRLKAEEEKQREKESKKQLRTEAERVVFSELAFADIISSGDHGFSLYFQAFEAWKSKKNKQMVRRHSVSVMNREKVAEELRAKLERATAAHLAFEAW